MQKNLTTEETARMY